MATYDAILPAGGRIDPEFAKAVGLDNKALITFEGKTILERLIHALRASGRIGRIVLIGPPEVLDRPEAQGADFRLEPAETGPDNIYRGLAALTASDDPPDKVLIVNTDLPFLTPAIVEQFLDNCPPTGDICVPLVARTEWDERFPNMSATFVQLKDGKWTTGCMYLMDVAAMQRIKPAIDRVFKNRKSKFGMARMLGPRFVAKFLLKTLTVADVEAKIVSMLGCTGKAIMNCPPEMAYDIDFQDDYDYARQQMGVPA